MVHRTSKITYPNRAIILAGGPGRRMGMLTSYGRDLPSGNIPKPAMPIVNEPNISRIVRQLIRHNVQEIWITTHYMAGNIINVIGHGERFGTNIKIHHHVEAQPQNTALAARNIALEHFRKDEPFWVIASDVSFPTADLQGFCEAFVQARKKSDQVVAGIGFVLRPTEETIIRYPVGIIDKKGILLSFTDKPQTTAEAESIARKSSHPEIKQARKKLKIPFIPTSSSIYLATPEVFKIVAGPPVAPHDRYDWGRYIFPKLARGSIFGHIFKEPLCLSPDGEYILGKAWIDMAKPKDLWRAQWRFLRAAPTLIAGNYSRRKHAWLGTGTINKGEVRNAVIGDGVYIGPDVVIENCIIGHGSYLDRTKVYGSLVLPFSYFNLRKDTGLVTNIELSVIGGKISGGSFFDARATSNTTKFKGILATPEIDGLVKTEDLGLDERDIEEMKEAFQK